MSTPIGADRVAVIARCRFCGWSKRIDGIRLGKVLGIPRKPWCPHHGSNAVRTREVKGTEVAGVECGPRCWKAATPSCRCSCGGAQHGTRL